MTSVPLWPPNPKLLDRLGPGVHSRVGLIEERGAHRAAALLGAAPPGPIDDDLPHHRGRHGEEVRPVLPFGARLVLGCTRR